MLFGRLYGRLFADNQRRHRLYDALIYRASYIHEDSLGITGQYLPNLDS